MVLVDRRGFSSAFHQVTVVRETPLGGSQRGSVIVNRKVTAGFACGTTRHELDVPTSSTRICGTACVSASARSLSQLFRGPRARIDDTMSSGVRPVTRYVFTVVFGPKKADPYVATSYGGSSVGRGVAVASGGREPIGSDEASGSTAMSVSMPAAIAAWRVAAAMSSTSGSSPNSAAATARCVI